MKCIYYPDHDKRYAHIPKSERWKYPDEISGDGFLFPTVKRVKNLNELTAEDFQGGRRYTFLPRIFHTQRGSNLE